NRFIHGAADDNFISYLEDMEKLNGMLNHRVLQENTIEARKFSEKKQILFKKMVEKYPAMTQLKKQYNLQFS
ncbi:MAG: hypothetical protein JEY91_07795, partial [Spirochaetaceae bacterium]|nr:hypothetical protein [Spirochaetaceae bacterium]